LQCVFIRYLVIFGRVVCLVKIAIEAPGYWQLLLFS
jgi:hypothetical protein